MHSLFVLDKPVFCKSKEEFDQEIGSDFIRNANQVTENNEEFFFTKMELKK